MAWNNNRYKGSKYGNKKVEVNGITFDSKKEAKRYGELLLLEKVGAIQDLRLQVKFVLIPSQYEYKWSEKKGEEVKGKCLERECTYVADFVYWDNNHDRQVVEDTKGFRTDVYKIKRKLMLKVHGIEITEI